MGGLLVVLGLPPLLLIGYFVRTVREAAQEGAGLPPWDNWIGLAVDGLAVLVATLLICIKLFAAHFLGQFWRAHLPLD